MRMDARRRQYLPTIGTSRKSRQVFQTQESRPPALFQEQTTTGTRSTPSESAAIDGVIETRGTMGDTNTGSFYNRSFSKSGHMSPNFTPRPITRSAILILVSFFVLFVTLNVHLLRSERCAHGLTSGLASSEYSIRPDLSTPDSQLVVKSVEVRDEDLVTDARRKRPMPVCASNGSRARAYFIVFMGHSGSTAILTDLRNHSQTIGGDTEPVDHQPVFNSTEALAITRRIFDHGIKTGLIAGFKIRPTHIMAAPDAWRSIVAEYDVRIIWQYRKNLFKAAIGEYTNRYLNDTSVVEGLHSNLTREERCKVGVGCSFKIEKFDALHTLLRNMIHSQKMITKAVAELSRDSPCVREVPYEDYLYDREGVMKDLFQFLGIQNENTAPARFKATGDRMCEIVQNWDQVCDNFYGCVLWQHMLDDPRNRCFCNMTSGLPTGQFCDV